MIILDLSKKKTEAFYRRLHTYLLVGMAGFGTMFFSLQMANPSLAFPCKEKQSFTYDTIGLGPLALDGMRTWNPLPTLPKELVLLGKNSRPDSKATDLLLGLKTTHQEAILPEGGTLFLTQGEDFSFSFSQEPTPLSITAVHTKKNIPERYSAERADVAHVEFHPPFGEEWEGEFTLKAGPELRRGLSDPSYLRAFSSAQGWGSDLLMQRYGGEEYCALSRKNKLSFATHACFVERGDYLQWKEGRWNGVIGENIVSSLPLAQVTALEEERIDLKVWDETGFSPKIVTIPKQKGLKMELHPGEILSAIYPRSPSEFSCFLGKKRIRLKQGDWWLKTQLGWRNLQSVQEMDDYLYHRTRGELFIFEGAENIGEDLVLKGQCFNTMRTLMAEVVIPLPQKRDPTPKSLRSSTDIRGLARSLK